MNKLSLFVCLLSLISLASSQTPAFRKSAKVAGTEKVLRDTTKPAVYLEFVKKGRIPGDRDSPHILFFHLTNNTKWPIRLDVMNYESRSYGEAKPDYVIEERRTGLRLDASHFCHVCSIVPLGAGKKLLFSIPFSSAEDRARLRVEYSFWWEDSVVGSGDSSTHSANFSFDDLPDGILTKP